MGFQYKQISIEERCEIARLRAAGSSLRQIAGDKPPRYISGFRLGPGKGMKMVGRRTVHSRRASRRVMGWGQVPALHVSLATLDGSRPSRIRVRDTVSCQLPVPDGAGRPRYGKPELWFGAANWHGGFCYAPPDPCGGQASALHFSPPGFYALPLSICCPDGIVRSRRKIWAHSASEDRTE